MASRELYATLITEDGELMPIVVHVPDDGEAVAFPLKEATGEDVSCTIDAPALAADGFPDLDILEPIEVEILDIPEASNEDDAAPSMSPQVVEGEFRLSDQPALAYRGGARWRGRVVQFDSFDAYGRAYLTELRNGVLRVSHRGSARVDREHCLRLRVPGFHGVEVRARVTAVQGPIAHLAIRAEPGAASLAPEQLVAKPIKADERPPVRLVRR